ncbi:MAG: V-type ATP synthase subunit E, partial [Treponema sp.]|nr:V-type ATP synthase subunit E [Treponema sp.]
MDVQLQELIDRIKKDGVASAEKSSEKIIADAVKKAAEIVSAAEEKAESIIKNAKAETKRMEKASEDAIMQAGRNMILSFRDSLVEELDKIVQSETAKAYSSDLLVKIIPETVKAWAKNTDAEDISVLLNENDLKELQSQFTAALKNEIAKGLEIKPDKTLANGFRIGIKNGTAFYDYSAESLA